MCKERQFVCVFMFDILSVDTVAVRFTLTASRLPPLRINKIRVFGKESSHWILIALIDDAVTVSAAFTVSTELSTFVGLEDGDGVCDGLHTPSIVHIGRTNPTPPSFCCTLDPINPSDCTVAMGSLNVLNGGKPAFKLNRPPNSEMLCCHIMKSTNSLFSTSKLLN